MLYLQIPCFYNIILFYSILLHQLHAGTIDHVGGDGCHDNRSTPEQSLDELALTARLAILVGKLGSYLLFDGLLVGLRLVDEVDGVDQIGVILAKEGLVLGKLHEVGSTEELFQLVYHLLVAGRLQMLYNLAAGHLHGTEAKALLYVLAQRGGCLLYTSDAADE